ncbi:MAG: hypothetical protein Kow0081_4580 [Candidatus Dojkabacteria bacterium]
MYNTKSSAKSKEQRGDNSSTENMTRASNSTQNNLLEIKNFTIGVVAAVAILVLAFAVILISNNDGDTDNANYIDYEESDEYTFQYPDSWVIEDEFGLELQPKAQFEKIKKLEEENKDTEFSLENINKFSDISVIRVTISDNTYDSDLLELVKNESCEEAAYIDSGSEFFGPGMEIENIRSFNLNGTMVCAYDSAFTFILDIQETTYLVPGEDKLFKIEKGISGDNVKGSYETQADKILESFSLL